MYEKEISMNKEINELINYGLEHHMIEESDVYYCANLILDIFGLDSFEREECDSRSIYEVLEDMLNYAVEKGMISDSVTEKDLLDTRIMNCLMPRPSEVVHTFMIFIRTLQKKLQIISMI